MLTRLIAIFLLTRLVFIDFIFAQSIDNTVNNQALAKLPNKISVVQEENVYNVSEAWNILRHEPERLKDKVITLEAAIVDAVMGTGCNDYFILTAPQDVSLYSKQYNQNLTLEEKVAIKNIIKIKSGETLSMSRGIAAIGKQGIFRGHFFDRNAKSCKDGQERFVITGFSN